MMKQLNEGIGHESNEPPERINQTVSVTDKENNGKACQQEKREMGDYLNTMKDPTEVQNASLNKQSENNVGDETGTTTDTTGPQPIQISNHVHETLFLDNISYEEAEQRRRQEEEEDIDNNMEGIAASGDLSPRQINKLKESNKKYKSNVVPFNTTTRSRKGQANQSDQ
ncbi:hypothetical protein KY289_024323 [Solanum tuberosum]|nr:hypothetical protein KY289_024323 [Solanum tuberosum]